MRKPNFFLIGAMRSGTTSLYQYLSQHPDIFLSKIKEPNYFVWDDETVDEVDHWFTIRDINEYLSLFSSVKEEKIIGECSHTYLYSSIAPKRIFDFNPDAYILVILRNPVERAYSHYMFLRRLGVESIDKFEKALSLEAYRIKTKKNYGHYIKRGFYYQQLLRWYEIFPGDKIKICLHEDLKNNSKNLIKSIFEFLEIDASFVPKIMIESQASGEIKIRWIYSMYRRAQVHGKQIQKLPESISIILKKLGNIILRISIEKKEMNKETRQQLISIYREDILRLQDLIKRDLTHWLQV